MAEDFQSSRDWWKISSTSSSGGAGAGAASYDGGSPATSNLSCSTTITDVTAAPFAYSAFGPSIDWSQTLLSNSGRAETGFQAMLQEDLHSKSDFSAPIQLKDMNHHHHHHHHHPFFFENSSIISSSGFPLVSSSSSSSIMQGLLEADSRVEQSLFDSQHMFHYEQSQFMQQKQQSSINQLQFSNNTPFWNASTSSLPFDLPMKSLEGGEKKSSSEPPMKKIRVESSSALPTFKVRKEKLGDRITALQQLVSPFGKTDTASVLHEAIEYIKFLHEQVNVLSTPYLKNGHPLQQQHQGSEKLKDDEWQKDLRSRGLCLVPIASTYPVATETTADFWTPTFGGNYR